MMREIEEEGLRAFAKSLDQALTVIGEKRRATRRVVTPRFLFNIGCSSFGS
jgi:hypothetical protein